jgi:hypothetical protein
VNEERQSQEPGPTRSRKSYEPPAAKKVPLRPQEAVLGFCKNDVQSGPRGAGNCHNLGACSSQGT